MTAFLSFFKSFTNLAWAAVVVFLCIMLTRSCSGKVELAQHDKATADSLRAQTTTLQASHTTDSIEKTTLIAENKTLRLQYQGAKDSDWIAFAGLQKKYRGLSGRILAEGANKPDTGVWVVPQQYVRQCDSCAIALAEGSERLNKLRYDDSATKALYDYELALRMSYEADLNHQFDSAMSLSGAKDRLIDKMAKDGKPRGSLKGGISLQYSQSYQQAGIWLMYDAKNGKCYGGGLNYNSFNKPCYEVRAGFTIFGK